MKLTDAKGKDYYLTGAEVTVGRRAGNDIVFDDERTSGRHAVIARSRTDFILTDAGSTNGTWVNGEKLQGSYKLKDGDIVQIGRVTLTFHAVQLDEGDEDPGTRPDPFPQPKQPAPPPAPEAPKAPPSPTPMSEMTPPPPSAKPVPASAASKDRTLALVLEIGASLFGFLGAGWVYAGEMKRGLIWMGGGLAALLVGLVGTLLTGGLLACLVVPGWLVAVGFSAWQLYRYADDHPALFR